MADTSSYNDRITVFRDAMRAIGLEFKKIIDDEEIHRGYGPGKKKHNNYGWYVLFENASGGAFGNWFSGEQCSWHHKGYTKLSQQERDAFDAKIKAKREQRQADYETVADVVTDHFYSKPTHGKNPYLAKKQIPPINVRFEQNGAMLIPVQDLAGKLWSYQRIHPSGSHFKEFYGGGRVKGGCCVLGVILPDKPLLICEGYATGVSLYLATQTPVVVAFNAGNLTEMVRQLAAQHDPSLLMICGDDDKWHDPASGKGNKGREVAEQAANDYGCKVVFPQFPETVTGQPTDFNDLHVLVGLQAVREQVGMTIEPAVTVKKNGGNQSFNDLNQQYAMVLSGGKCSILHETKDEEGRHHVDLLGVESFKAWVGKEAGGGWLGWDGRRKYKGIIFDPANNNAQFYNLWRGFAVQPRQGDWNLFADHLLENLCHGDENHYIWVLAWFAQMLQQPEKKNGTALAVRGKMGTGKTLIGEVFGRILGDHYKLVADPRLITGNFNAHLANCLLLHSDEGFWAGDKQMEGVLKSLITAGTIAIERKGYEPTFMKNMTRLYICTNNDWVAPSAMEERRFCVMDIADTHMQDRKYFGAMLEQLENGGYAGLLHDLLAFDLNSINLWQLPVTNAQVEQKQMSMALHYQWWLDKLEDGALFPKDNDITPWPELVEVNALYEDYLEYCKIKHHNYPIDRRHMGRELHKLLPGGTDVCQPRAGGRKRHYRMPDLQRCRAHWDEMIGQASTWETADCDAPNCVSTSTGASV